MYPLQQQRNILIVEDNLEDQVAIRRYLSLDPRTRFTIHEAINGRQGLSQCQSLQLDCVLLDYNLPDMTGTVFLDQLRIKFNQPFLPVVVLTGSGSETIAVQSMQRGAQDYLLKEQLAPTLLHYAIANAMEKMSMARQVEEQRLELAHQHRAFQMLAENAPDIIARFDTDLRHLYVNPAVTQATGLSAEIFVGKTNRELGMPEDFCTIWEERLREAFATGQVKQLEYIFPTPSGARFYQARLAPEFNAERQVISVLSISRDVTDIKRTEIALRESEQRLRMAFSVAKMGTWDWDINTGNLGWSEEHEALLGLPAGTFGGTYDAFIALVHPDDIANVTRQMQQALDLHIEYQVDFRMYGADGKIYWATARGKATYNDAGRPIQMLGIVLDITEHKLAEQQAIQHANDVDAIIEAINDSLFLFDADGKMIRLNRAARELLDFSPEKLGDQTSIPQVSIFDEHGLPLPLEQRPVARVLRGERLGGPTPAEVRMRRSDGREMQLSVTGTSLWNKEGNITGAILVARDVTMRRQLEQRTHTALEALLLMAENLVSFEGPGGTVEHPLLHHLADLTARVLNGKDVMLAVLAFATNQIETVVQMSESVPLPDVRAGMLLSDIFQDPLLLDKLFAGNAVSFDMQRLALREDMQRLALREGHPPVPERQALLIPLRLRGVLIGVMTLAPNDPQHRYLADELTLAEAVGKLVALVIERDRLLQEREEAVANERVARETSQRMDDFIGIVSHELKNPLTSLRGNIQIAKGQLSLLAPQEDDQLSQTIALVQLLLDRAERQVMAQNRLVNDLVDVTRIRMDKLELQLAPCDLHQIVQEIVEDQRRLTLKRVMTVVGYEGEVMVLADPQRVGQVINNYLSNALKYSAEQTPVEVRLEIQGPVARIAVRDEGPGLAQDVQQHIWDRFYRAPGVKAKSGTGVGLGLGLHICRTIIEQQGGTVGVQSSEGQGSTFWFTLPLMTAVSNPQQDENHDSASSSTGDPNHS